MRVLKKGRQQKGWSKELRCTGAGNGDGGCSALLLVEQADVFETSSSHYDGSTDLYATFACGACGVLTDIKGHLPFTPGPRSKKRSSDG